MYLCLHWHSQMQYYCLRSYAIHILYISTALLCKEYLGLCMHVENRLQLCIETLMEAPVWKSGNNNSTCHVKS